MSPTFLAAGTACEQVYLVCLTGVVTAAELRECVVLCKIGGVRLGGLVLNDLKQVSANLLNLNLAT